MTVNIAIIIAIALLTAAVVVLNTKTKVIEEEINSMTTAEIAETKIEAVEEKCAESEAEINTILNRLKEIADDIGELDGMQKQDHRDLVDIRTRYVNYREPVANGAGVAWAKDFPCNEDEEHE